MLDRQTVERVAGYYPPQEQAKDDTVFSDDFRRPILARRYLEMKDLLRIADWKSPRPKPLLRSNSPDLLRTVTQKAFAERDPEEAIRQLDRLRGVSVRMASAILTIYQPGTYTTLDQKCRRCGYPLAGTIARVSSGPAQTLRSLFFWARKESTS